MNNGFDTFTLDTFGLDTFIHLYIYTSKYLSNVHPYKDGLCLVYTLLMGV